MRSEPHNDPIHPNSDDILLGPLYYIYHVALEYALRCEAEELQLPSSTAAVNTDDDFGFYFFMRP